MIRTLHEGLLADGIAAGCAHTPAPSNARHPATAAAKIGVLARIGPPCRENPGRRPLISAAKSRSRSSLASCDTPAVAILRWESGGHREAG